MKCLGYKTVSIPDYFDEPIKTIIATGTFYQQ